MSSDAKVTDRDAYTACLSSDFMGDEDTQKREFELAVARTTIGMTKRNGGSLNIEESVYGAALVMPQLARTSGWNKTFTIGAIQAWLFLFLNVCMQAYLLKMISEAEHVNDLFGGQMYVCDFGATTDECPLDAKTPSEKCKPGPFGSVATAPRMYDWDSIINRQFMKDSLTHLFPDKIKDIDAHLDVGEYGIENYWCRFVCCFIFMIACMEELVLIIKMAQLHWLVPTKDEPWLQAKPRTKEQRKISNRLSGTMSDPDPLKGDIQEVRVFIAGMPFFWKFFNMIVVVLPKFFLWKFTTEVGTTFLMETASIVDIVINSVGLTFILGLDEMICRALMSDETLAFCEATENYNLFDEKTSCVGDMSVLTDDEILEKYKEKQHGCRSVGFWDVVALLPGKLIMSLLLTAIFVYEYYYKHCTQGSQDQMVSQPMYTPTTAEYGWGNAFLPMLFPQKFADEPYWQMPKA